MTLDPGGAAAATAESGPAAGEAEGSPAPADPEPGREGAKGRHIATSLLLPSKALALRPIRRTVPEAGGRGREAALRYSHVSQLPGAAGGERPRGQDRHTEDVQPRQRCPSASPSLPPAACRVECVIHLSYKEKWGFGEVEGFPRTHTARRDGARIAVAVCLSLRAPGCAVWKDLGENSSPDAFACHLGQRQMGSPVKRG